MNYWFTSDTHFGHNNILKFSNRPFKSIEEHDELLIQNWNKVVDPKDNVYHLGDFAFKNRLLVAEIRRRLNGNIHLIMGSHDRSVWQIRHTFIWCKSLWQVKVYNQFIILCHCAFRVWEKSHYGSWHLYGHSHYSLKDDPNSLSIDVGVDAVAGRLSGVESGDFVHSGTTKPEDYRPMNFDEIHALMSKKTFVPIDHHRSQKED